MNHQPLPPAVNVTKLSQSSISITCNAHVDRSAVFLRYCSRASCSEGGLVLILVSASIYHVFFFVYSSTIIFLNIYYYLFNTNASFSLPSDLSLLLLAVDDPAVRAIHVLACSWSSFWGDWEVLMSTCLWYVFSIFLNLHTTMPTSVPSNFHSGRNSGLFCKAMTSCTFTRVKRHTSR